MNKLHMTPPQRERRKRVIIVAVCAVGTILATIWVLSAVGKISGIVATILSIIITVLGLTLAVLDIIGAFEKKQDPIIPDPLVTPSPSPLPIHLPVEDLGVTMSVEDLGVTMSKHRGAIVVWLSSNTHYLTLSIGHGFDPMPRTCKSASVEKYKEICKVAIFSPVMPGPYTLFTPNLKKTCRIYVDPNHITEVDWRSCRGAK